MRKERLSFPKASLTSFMHVHLSLVPKDTQMAVILSGRNQVAESGILQGRLTLDSVSAAIPTPTLDKCP